MFALALLILLPLPVPWPLLIPLPRVCLRHGYIFGCCYGLRFTVYTVTFPVAGAVAVTLAVVVFDALEDTVTVNVPLAVTVGYCCPRRFCFRYGYIFLFFTVALADTVVITLIVAMTVPSLLPLPLLLSWLYLRCCDYCTFSVTSTFIVGAAV